MDVLAHIYISKIVNIALYWYKWSELLSFGVTVNSPSDEQMVEAIVILYSHWQGLFNNTKQVLSKPGLRKMLSAATGLLDITELVAANSWDMYLTFIEKKFFRFL